MRKNEMIRWDRKEFPFIYIVINGRSVSLYHNSSGRLNTRDFSSWNRNPTDVKSVEYRSLRAIDILSVSEGIFTYIFIHKIYRLPECSVHEKRFWFTRLWQPATPPPHVCSTHWWGHIYRHPDRLLRCIFIYIHLGWGRNILYILNCHLCGASEFGQMAIVTLTS